MKNCTTIDIFIGKITYLQKNTWKYFHDFFSPKVRTEFVFWISLPNLTHFSIILTLMGINYIYIIPIMDNIYTIFLQQFG